LPTAKNQPAAPKTSLSTRVLHLHTKIAIANVIPSLGPMVNTSEAIAEAKTEMVLCSAMSLEVLCALAVTSKSHLS